MGFNIHILSGKNRSKNLPSHAALGYARIFRAAAETPEVEAILH
jgi:hypothetical protein